MREWISDTDMIKYHKAVSERVGCYMVWDGVALDRMSNADYKIAILECHRKALDDIPMPSETRP